MTPAEKVVIEHCLELLRDADALSNSVIENPSFVSGRNAAVRIQIDVSRVISALQTLTREESKP